MAVYAAQLDIMDQGVGRILAALERSGIDDDTMVMFLSDNGGCHEFITPGSRWVGTLNTGTRGGRPMTMGNLPDVLPGDASTYQSYTLPWANASNTPFRLHKHWVHEGGIATPLIVRYPGVAKAGRITHAVSHVIDVLPTCLDAAGVAYPEQFDGRRITPAAGRSMMPFIRGEEDRDGRIVYWEHEGNLAVRDGRWKLVSKFTDGREGPWELYDTIEDRTELNDLAAAKGDTVREMSALHDRWSAAIAVVPWQQLIQR
jgi:arylsulfatase